MILNQVAENLPVLSNVGQVNSFTIKATAKSFRILADGLYGDKIRAIVREISCNALDSHVAAGKGNIPFDVHLPNQLEPWFSVRDYGTGLNNDQVTNIFTTFFESTKTGSNDFVGALGLGSKSPFSYTDNFTVTAVRDGRKGIYTAFINEQGVPSIALMMEEASDDPAGVEIKFAVETANDFSRFREAARKVYAYFKLQPVVSGSVGFEPLRLNYTEQNIIPGVHLSPRSKVAVMGNIAYPIEIPNSATVLGDLDSMLNCGITMEFEIGELDFQASREGLSYIPQTINAIKAKLELLKQALTDRIKAVADKIDNLWARAIYINDRYCEEIWREAVVKYVTDTKFELFGPSQQRWHGCRYSLLNPSMTIKDLASKYNLSVRAFSVERHYAAATQLKPSKEYNTPVDESTWEFNISTSTRLVFNDTKVGAFERAKYHYKNEVKSGDRTRTVYLFDAAVKDKPVLKDKFLKDIFSPPSTQVVAASTLTQKERQQSVGKNVTILRLEKKNDWRGDTLVWRDAGKATSYDSSTTRYYLPLSGYTSLGIAKDVHHFKRILESTKVFTGEIYGVRKSDIEWVKTQKNWVNLDEHLKTILTSSVNGTYILAVAKAEMAFNTLYKFEAVSLVTDPNSPYLKLYEEFKGVKALESGQASRLQTLYGIYGISVGTTSMSAAVAAHVAKADVVRDRYPLLDTIGYGYTANSVSQYINLIDQSLAV